MATDTKDPRTLGLRRVVVHMQTPQKLERLKGYISSFEELEDLKTAVALQQPYRGDYFGFTPTPQAVVVAYEVEDVQRVFEMYEEGRRGQK